MMATAQNTTEDKIMEQNPPESERSNVVHIPAEAASNSQQEQLQQNASVTVVIPMPMPEPVSSPVHGGATAGGGGLTPSSSTSSSSSSTSAAAASANDDIPPPKADFYAPPPYEIATKMSSSSSKLPTYEEAQREKEREEHGLGGIPVVNTVVTARSPFRPNFIEENVNLEDVDTSLLGTDFMFYVAFFVAFIFNWIGFLLLMCFCHTIASRYGALSGFGLSLAKWTFIVQHSTDLASKDNSWLWWLIMTFGLIICIRAILQYLSIKRGWHMLSANHQERLLFFY